MTNFLANYLPSVVFFALVALIIAYIFASNRPMGREKSASGNFAIVMLVVIAVIYYGSFYPFDFRIPNSGLGPVRTLLNSWADKPGRGDFLSNILLYMPLGYFGFHALRKERGAGKRMALVVLLGTLMCISVELTQYYDEGRDTAATDVYSNVLGTLFGAIVARILGGRAFSALLNEKVGDRAALMLLAAWGAERLYPYVPTIDLHKYWNTIKALIFQPSLPPYELFRQVAIWLTVAAFVTGIVGERRVRRWFTLLVLAVLFAKILIITAVLSWAEIVGAFIALALCLLFFGNRRLALLIPAVVLIPYVIALRLEPFHFAATGKSFEWIPFYGFMQGSINTDVLAFLEKFYFYGGVIWLLHRQGVRLRTATWLVAAGLFVTSWVELYLPGRSAEIGDALLALVVGGVIGLIGEKPVVITDSTDDWRAQMMRPAAGSRWD